VFIVSQPPSQGSLQTLPVDVLDFDPENPRFYDGGQTIVSAEKSIKRMIEQEAIEELVGSIGNQGFFDGEPLLVTPNEHAENRYIVVEGNRRLAALRALNGLIDKKMLPPSLIGLVDSATHRPPEVACFVFDKRKDVLKNLGFRHISGAKRWEPLSKARYLADLIANFYSHLDQEMQLRAVAKDIGSRRDYVAQLLTALNLYDRAQRKQFYGLQRVDESDISFSLLSSALSYSHIVAFLNLPRRDVVTVDTVNDAHAKELFSWMFAQNESGATVLGESRRLKTLAAVVSSERAVAELRKHHDLDKAYVFTTGPSETFNTLLSGIESDLNRGISMIGSDFDLEQGHLVTIENIIDQAENLQILMQKAIRQQQKKRARQADIEGDVNA
jgi:hypothetical protein